MRGIDDGWAEDRRDVGLRTGMKSFRIRVRLEECKDGIW